MKSIFSRFDFFFLKFSVAPLHFGGISFCPSNHLRTVNPESFAGKIDQLT